MTILGRTDLHQDSECKHILGEMDKVAAYGFRGSENFIFLYIYFMCMCVLLICMSVTKYLQCPRRPVERVGTGVTLWTIRWKLGIQPGFSGPVLLRAELWLWRSKRELLSTKSSTSSMLYICKHFWIGGTMIWSIFRKGKRSSFKLLSPSILDRGWHWIWHCTVQ